MEESLETNLTNTDMEWISVKDRLPENPDYYLIACPVWSESGQGIGFFTGEKWQDEVVFTEIHQYVTHWMPLPEPPKP